MLILVKISSPICKVLKMKTSNWDCIGNFEGGALVRSDGVVLESEMM